MGLIFISYSRKDAPTVEELVARLKKDGFEVWFDKDNIKGGDLWTVAIVEAIDTADAFVLMLSPSAVESDNVRKELHLAQDSKKSLFPLLLAAVQLPPQFRYQLAGIQWIDYAGEPEKKYQELVEVLRANREKLAAIKQPETRQAEVVLSNEKIASFGTKKKGNLLAFLSKLTGAEQANLSIANLTSGSVHAFVEMPRHAAYVLKTAALNREKQLTEYGIDAVRLNGEENYILVNTGEVSPLNSKPRGSFFQRILSIVIGLGIIVVVAILFTLSTKFGNELFFGTATPTKTTTPTFTFTPTRTNTATFTPTHTLTFTPTRTATFTATSTVTLTPTRTLRPTNTIPPPAPEISFKADAMFEEYVMCGIADDQYVELIWNEPANRNGINQYQVVLQAHINNQWRTIRREDVSADTLSLVITSEINNPDYCGLSFRARVRAMDQAGVWSNWSRWLEFPTIPPPG